MLKALLTSTFLSLGLTAGLFISSGSASAEECGTVTIANMTWQSAEVLANIDKIILDNGYGCNAELVAGDTVPTLTSMIEKGEPDVATEGWLNTVRDVLDNAVKEGKLLYAAEVLSDGGVESWWVPQYFAEAHPDIKTINDALAHPELFPAPDDKSKGAVFNCPAGWQCEITTANFFRAYEGEKKGFVLVDTGSAAGLDGSIAKAYERKEPWLGYYWEPTAILGKYPMVKLDNGVPFNAEEWKRCNAVADCPDPKPNGWPRADVFTVVAKSFADRAGPALDYLKTRKWSNETVNKLLAWMTDNQATGEDAAKYFLQNNEDIWKSWVSPEAAEKIKAAVQ